MRKAFIDFSKECDYNIEFKEDCVDLENKRISEEYGE